MGNSASLSSLPYTIGDEIEDPSRQGSYGWSIHSGKRKSDGLPVCVFKGSKPKLLQTPVSRYFPAGGASISIGPKDRVDPNSLLIPAFKHFQKSKTLVHPNLLKVYATLDTDAPADAAPASGGVPSSPYANTGTGGDLIIVTEEVTPLLKWMQQREGAANNTADQIAWGLVGIIQALGFLHSNAKMSHCSLSPESIFVTPGGDFKLGNFSLLQQVGGAGNSADEDYFRTYEAFLCPTPYRCPERDNGDHAALLTTLPSHIMDSYSLGQLIEDLYTDVRLAVPEKLLKALARLKTPKTQQRPRVAPLLRCPALDTPHVKSMYFLSDIDVKPAEEKISFLQSVPDQVTRTVLTRDALKHKLLPSMMRSLQNIARNPAAIGQDVNRREVMAITPVIFIIGETLSDDEFQSQLSPLVSLLFQLNDRGVRAALLQRLGTFTGRLDKNAINSTVFEPMCTGFTDSSGALRELTLKSTIPLIPHLNSVNLEKLGRYLVRLQSDPENSIRTNTVIFISKIAPSLAKTSREKLLLPAFVRAMRDPFPPCRLAALKSILHCKEFFVPKAVAEQVLPSVVPHLVDPTEQVRKEAFGVMDEFLVVLRKEGTRLGQIGDPIPETGIVAGPAAPSAGNLPTSPASAGGAASSSYLSGLTSYMWSQTKPSDDGDGAAAGGPTPSPTSAPTNLQQPETMSTQAAAAPSTGVDPLSSQLGAMHTNADIGDGGGWPDEEDVLIDTTFNNNISTAAVATPMAPVVSQTATLGKSLMDMSNPDDFFSSTMVGTRKSGGGLGGGFGSGGVHRLNPAGGAGKKLMVPAGGGGAGGSKSKTSLAERKAEFARKKAERDSKQQQQQQATKLDSGLADGWDDF